MRLDLELEEDSRTMSYYLTHFLAYFVRRKGWDLLFALEGRKRQARHH